MTLIPATGLSDAPMFAPRRGSLKDQISVHHVEGAQTARTTQQIYDRSLPSLHFLRWRPMFHLLAPNAWMNDPCGPGYDPSTGLYHISFQWNPRRNKHGNVAWGKVAWGSATSKDLLSWNLSSAPTLKPDQPYDEEGIFTGCMVPTGVDGSPATLTAIYTSVSGSPVHYSLPYTRGCETQSVAQSTDGGKTWTKSETNPILSEPPTHLTPCGWRDPYVAPWPTLDKALGIADDSNIYAVVSGGIAGRTPTLFLYAVSRNQLDKWTFLSPLIDVGLNHRLSRWSGDMGQNWESGTFMTLADDTTSRDFIVAAAEGCRSNEAPVANGLPQRSTAIPKSARSQQWMSGGLVAQRSEASATVEMKYGMGGRLDHGCLYGVNTFWDPVNKQQIAWGWIREEDLPQHFIDRQNWSGLLSLPRELKLITLRNVLRAWSSDLQSITSLEVTPSESDPNSNTVRTLGIYPASTLKRLRPHSRELSLRPNLPILRTQTTDPNVNRCSLDVQTCRFELLSSIAIPKTFKPNSTVNISISHSPSHDLHTTLSFCPSTETLTLHRPDSSSVDSAIVSTPETAPHTLFTFRDPGDPGMEVVEKYDVRLWFDESVLEVFANGRTVISSRIYPGRKRIWGIGFWVGELDEDVEMGEADAGQGKERSAGANTPFLVDAKAFDGLRADIKII